MYMLKPMVYCCRPLWLILTLVGLAWLVGDRNFPRRSWMLTNNLWIKNFPAVSSAPVAGELGGHGPAKRHRRTPSAMAAQYRSEIIEGNAIDGAS